MPSWGPSKIPTRRAILQNAPMAHAPGQVSAFLDICFMNHSPMDSASTSEHLRLLCVHLVLAFPVINFPSGTGGMEREERVDIPGEQADTALTLFFPGVFGVFPSTGPSSVCNQWWEACFKGNNILPKIYFLPNGKLFLENNPIFFLSFSSPSLPLPLSPFCVFLFQC